MQSVALNEDAVGNFGVVCGVFVEVLWDIEVSNCNGRRVGVRSVDSTWWRAEVVNVERIYGRCKAQLRYDERDGFKEQLGNVWVFPRHIRLVEDDRTQLRWRFFECSGDVSYDLEDERGSDLSDKRESSSSCDASRLDTLQEQVGTMMHKYETIERMIVAQNLVFSRLLGAGSASDRQSAHLFSALSQKIAVLMQKPIPPVKTRREDDDNSSFFEDNSQGSLRVDIDCEYQTFQSIARVVRSKLETAWYRPSFTDMQCPSRTDEDAEIVFDSFGDLARVIGINSSSDLMRMCVRQRGNLRQREKGSTDIAVRALGTCLFNPDEENSAMAILVCKSIHEGNLSQDVEAFVRDSREFDFDSRAYRKRLISRRCTGQSLMRSVFSAALEGLSQPEQVSRINMLSSQLSNFTIRWSPLTPPNSRTWSRSLCVPKMDSGIVEVDIPFLLFRGSDSASEMMEYLSDSLVAKQLK